MRKVSLLTLVAVAGFMSTVLAAPPEGPALPDLLAKAGQYVARYERDFDQVTAEEDWTQKLFQHRNQRLEKQRKLLSDLTFMHPGGDLRWIEYRDVWSVDGKPVHEHDGRLEKLFVKLAADSYVKAQAIADEGVQYEVRPLGNFDMPTLALVFLHADNQSRFKWKRKGKSTVAGASAWAVDFEETGKPTFIGDGGRDLVSRGTVWIGEADGAVLRSENRLKDASGQIEVDVTIEFGPWPEGGILVPTEMREMFLFSPSRASNQMLGMRESPGDAIGSTESGEYVETMATYSSFKSLRKTDTAPAKGTTK